MKENFFNKHKKKSAAALLLLFLKGRGKYLAIILAALLVSAPLVVTSDSFKAFTNHPAIAAALRSLGFGGYAFDDKDMVAQAAHNSSGKKSSYWLNYFRRINAPLPSEKFTSMKYLDGNIKDLAPVKIADRTKNKYGINGVVNEANYTDGADMPDGVDLSQLLAADGSGATNADFASMDSVSTTLELGTKSSAAPYVGRNTFVGNGTVLSKSDAFAERAEESLSTEVPEAPGIPGMKKVRKYNNGRVSSFAWSRNSHGKRVSAFSGGSLNSKSARSTIKEAYGYSMSAAEMENVAEADTTASAAFDGNKTGGSVLETGEPVSVGSGSYAAYVSGATNQLKGQEECGRAMAKADEASAPLFDQNAKTSESMGCRCKSCCGPWKSQRRRKKEWNNKVGQMASNCRQIERNFAEANTESCKGTISLTDQNCGSYDSMKVSCGFLASFAGFFGIDTGGRCD